jgi:NitT/TauT family transport system permease protein
VPWVVIVLVWYGIHVSGAINPALVPAPHSVASRFWALLYGGRLAGDIAISTQRVVLGIAFGIAAAVPIGIMLGWYVTARRLITPVLNFFRALPPIALIPLVIVYFGIGEVAKVIVIFASTFFSTVIVMYEGVVQMNPIYLRVARSLGASDGEIFRKVILPLSLPHVLTAMRLALGIGWATLVASELIAAHRGLGSLIQDATSYFQLDVLYVGIICIGVVALTMDLLLRTLTRKLLSWQDRMA